MLVSCLPPSLVKAPPAAHITLMGRGTFAMTATHRFFGLTGLLAALLLIGGAPSLAQGHTDVGPSTDEQARRTFCIERPAECDRYWDLQREREIERDRIRREEAERQRGSTPLLQARPSGQTPEPPLAERENYRDFCLGRGDCSGNYVLDRPLQDMDLLQRRARGDRSLPPSQRRLQR